ncbi:MAG: AraC family transcriptional regulator [Roseivirga sp.]|nr:AraC family transcriptional regulator [Roseivirga sp.]
MQPKTYSFYPSPPVLRSQIEIYRLVEVMDEIYGETVANARMDAVIVLNGKIETSDSEEDSFTPLPDCSFFPFTRSGATRVHLEAGTRLINIKLYPHVLASSCFDGLSLQKSLDFNTVFGKDFPISSLVSPTLSPRPDSLKAQLDSFFEEHLLNKSTPNALLNQVFSFVESDTNETVSLATLASDSGVSIKTLERQFKNYTGLTIKMYRDLVRFQKTTSSIHANGHYHHGDLLEALGSGYYDQSHFVKASRKLTGLSPKELFQRLPGEITDFVVF